MPIDGPLVRTIRVAQRIELADLAARVGISRSYLTQIETGARNRVSVSVLGALEHHLGLDTDVLPVCEVTG